MLQTLFICLAILGASFVVSLGFVQGCGLIVGAINRHTDAVHSLEKTLVDEVYRIAKAL